MKNRTVAYWLCQTLGWGTYTVIGILATILSQGGIVGISGMWIVKLLANYAIFLLTIILLTHLLRAQIRKRQWLSLPVPRLAPRLLTASILVGLCSSLQVIALDTVTLRGLSDQAAVLSLTISMISTCIIWSVLYVVIVRARHAREMETHLRDAQLRALESQVNPHFLFNCLNTIRGMIVEDAPVAQDMVTRLANILRYSLQRERAYTVPLEREIEIVADYLAIESIRFADRLTVRMEIQHAAEQAQVPSMLIQTLVENAVKHGIGARAERGEIVIRASIRNGALAMEVVNSGQLSAPNEGTTQIGLSNARERLRLLYGKHASLRLENRDAANVAAMVSIPA
jgi:two-component system sensor histidine kinase AlgZ